jgi:polar amino acid transport system substrate-binding protein
MTSSPGGRGLPLFGAAILTLAMAAPVAAQDASQTAAAAGSSAAPIAADGYLARILDAGVIRMSTDPAYPPQSELVEGEIVGFDIDVGKEIAKRLGVELALETPDFALVSAGNWSDRWDFSVGSVTITTPRLAELDFTQPYYYTPAQLAVHADSGISSIEGLAGQTICVGENTTYLQWLQGTLDLPSETIDVPPPEGAVAVTRTTDRDCAQEWGLGRVDFPAWLTSSTTVEDAIADGLPVVMLGDPIFYEPLAVAFDKDVEDNDSLVAAVDAIVGQMHADGTLSELSQKWYGMDLTKKVEG